MNTKLQLAIQCSDLDLNIFCSLDLPGRENTEGGRCGDQKDEDCVPDSSNANEEESHEEEQHSSGSVDEELLEEDEVMETKPSEEEEGTTEEKPVSTPAEASPPNSLVGELMNKFGFSDILEYQEAYRKAVQESRGSLKDMEVAGENNNDEEKMSDQQHKEQNGLKLRNDITIDSQPNFNKLSKSEIFQNFQTLKRLRPDYNGRVPERETLFAGNNNYDIMEIVEVEGVKGLCQLSDTILSECGKIPQKIAMHFC